jgi:transposase
VTFCNHEGLLRSRRLPHSAAQLLIYVRQHFSEERLAIAYEAGPTGFGLYDELVAAGHPCLVVVPSMVPTAPGTRVKTNWPDSKKLSVALRGGDLKGQKRTCEIHSALWSICSSSRYSCETAERTSA